jgi:hypothetical protein
MSIFHSNANQSEMTGRRRFLNSCLLLGSATAAPASLVIGNRLLNVRGGLTGDNQLRLVQVQKETKDLDLHSYNRLKTNLASYAVNPWLKKWMERPSGPEDTVHHIEWLVGIRPADGCKTSYHLLDFIEYCGRELTPAKQHPGKELSFEEWLSAFKPKNRDDYLMALRLYHNYYRRTGAIIPLIKPTPDPWLDAMLRSTRGMLFWQEQFTTFIRLAGDTTLRAAQQLVRDYSLNRPGNNASAFLSERRYFPTGQSLMQIVEERSPYPLKPPEGTPDYITGDWLHKNLSKS